MTTVFKVGDELVHVYGYLRPVRVKSVFADVYEIDYGPGVETQIVAKRLAHASYRLRVKAPHAPPESFRQVFCAWTGQTPVKPEPTRLEAARSALYAAVQRPHELSGHQTRALADELIAAARAEAIAEREAPEPRPYGQVLATASASYHTSDFDGDDTVLTFYVRVPYGHPIATTPTHRVNYTVTATSKGER